MTSMGLARWDPNSLLRAAQIGGVSRQVTGAGSLAIITPFYLGVGALVGGIAFAVGVDLTFDWLWQ
jgi:hypothetical protein